MTSPSDTHSEPAAATLNCGTSAVVSQPATVAANGSYEIDCDNRRTARSPAHAHFAVAPTTAMGILHKIEADMILEAADKCVAIRATMDIYAAARPRGTALGQPAFMTLVHDFVAAFTELTAAVDPLQERGEDWERYIADARLLGGLRAGLAGWKKHCRKL